MLCLFYKIKMLKNTSKGASYMSFNMYPLKDFVRNRKAERS
ncbi:hypothetical protein AusDCA_1877 [Desulfitobacterium sp. AusDCA]